MVKYTIPNDLYYWFIEKAELGDDHRNTQDENTGRLILHRDVGMRLINGIHLVKVMNNLRKVVITRSTKPFSLNEGLQHLKDMPGGAAKQQNWSLLATELKKFNIKVSKDSISLIVNESND